MEEIIKKRWKSKRGKVVGFNNNNLPTFKKVFLDVHLLTISATSIIIIKIA